MSNTSLCEVPALDAWRLACVARSAALASILLCGYGAGGSLRGLGAEDKASVEFLRFLAEGYASNRELFDAFVCRFTITRGTAASVDDCFAGSLRERETADVYWACDQDIFRYELTYREAPLIEPPMAEPEAGQLGVLTAAARIPELALAGETHGVSYCPPLVTANLLPRSTHFPAIMITPFNLDIMGNEERWSPGAYLARAGQGGEEVCRYEGEVEFQGKRLHKVVTARRPNADRQMTWLLDPEQGFLPLRATRTMADGAIDFDLHVTRVQRCANGGFVPAESIRVDYLYNEAGYFAQHITLVDMIVDRPPTKDELTLTLPAGTEVVDTTDMRSMFRLERDEQVTAESLDSLFERCQKALTARVAEQSELGARQTQSKLWVGLLLLGAAAAFALLWFLRRGQRNVSSH